MDRLVLVRFHDIPPPEALTRLWEKLQAVIGTKREEACDQIFYGARYQLALHVPQAVTPPRLQAAFLSAGVPVAEILTMEGEPISQGIESLRTGGRELASSGSGARR